MTETIASLRKMNAAEYDIWLEYGTLAYAQDKQKALGISAADAMELSLASNAKYMPDGLQSKDQHFYTVRDGAGSNVGVIWFNIKTEWGITSAFVLDLEITSAQRGKGYGRAAMAQIEPIARKLGASKIGLHVFGGNDTALRLYQRAGFAITDISMSKPL